MPKKRLNDKFRINGTTGGGMGLGRYMGNAPASEPVGVIHGQEYAVSQPIVQALGGPNMVETVLAKELERRGARGFQTGGSPSYVQRWNLQAPQSTQQTLGAPVSNAPNVPSITPIQPQAPQASQTFNPVVSEAPGVPTAPAPSNWQVASTQTVNPMISETPGQAGAPGPGGIAQATEPVTVAPPAGTSAAERTHDTQPATGLGSTTVTSDPTLAPTTSASGLGAEGAGDTSGLQTQAPAPVTGLGAESTYTPPAQSPEDQALERSVAILGNIASGQDPTQRAIAENAIADMQARHAAERDQFAQQLGQAGITGREAMAQLASLAREQGAREAQLAGDFARDAQDKAQQAAVQLGEMEATQEQLDIADAAQNLSEEKFAEYIRQFDVGSEQWEAAYNLRLAEFERGSEMWEKTYNEKIRQFNVGSDQWNKAFNEKIREFEVGSDQWEKALNEKIRQFEVGSDQWEREYKERMHQFDVGSEQWNRLHDQRERQFNANIDQWNRNFDEQRRQFNVGSEQWNNSFQEQIRQWKATMDQKDRQWMDSMTLQEQQQALNRQIAEANMGVAERKVSMLEDTHANQQYWDESKKFATYASTHLDAVNEQGEIDWDAKQAAFAYAKSKYPGFGAGMETTDQFENEDPDGYEKFLDWARGEYGAAQDGRLTNPYDATIHAINSSTELPQATKDLMVGIFTDPNLMAQVAGVKVNDDGTLSLISFADADQAAGEENTFMVDRPPTETGPAGLNVMGEDVDTISDVEGRISPNTGNIGEIPGTGTVNIPPVDQGSGPPTIPIPRPRGF